MSKKVIRDYQHDAVLQIGVGFEAGLRSVLITLATGLGKTHVAYLYTAELFLAESPQGRVLFLVHSIDILEQARQEFLATLPQMKDQVGVLTGTEKVALDRQVLFATFQSMAGRLSEFSKDSFELLIIDEAHHAVAPSFRPVVEYFTAKRIGLTATPERMDGLDIMEMFEDVVYDYPLHEAIVDEWLSAVDYHLHIDNINELQLREYVKSVAGGDRRVTKKMIDDTLFLTPREEGVAKIVTAKQNELREQSGRMPKTIHFFVSLEHVAHAEAFYPNALPYHSGMSKKELAEVFAYFKSGDLSEIMVVDKFNEGVDIPDSELLVFHRATDSERIWLQQLGRGTRRTDTKTKVTVLDFVGNCDRVLYVNELGGLAREYAEAQGLQQDSLTLTNLPFQISFSLQTRDLLSMLMSLTVAKYETYEEASMEAQRLGIKVTEYRTRYKEDPRLPSNPDKLYADRGWVSWKRFLNKDVMEKYETYEEASTATRRLGIKTGREYSARYAEDPRLPSNPGIFYANHGWVSLPEFLGTEKYKTHEEASAVARELGIKTQNEYVLRHKEDPRLPGNPSRFYANLGWVSWPKFFGTVKYEVYDDASMAAQKLGIKTAPEYKLRYKEDPRLPSNPERLYADRDWVSWKEFLDTERYETYKEAKAAAQKLGIKSWSEYGQRYKEDPHLPSNPSTCYANLGWVSHNEFLGNEAAKRYEVYDDASMAAQKLGIKTAPEYKLRYKEDPRLPSNPSVYYANLGWVSWRKFLGTEKHTTSRD